MGADQGFRAPSGDQESVRDSVHEESGSAVIVAGQRPRPSFRHPHPFWEQTPDEALFYIEVAKRLNRLCYHDNSDTTITAIAKHADLAPQTVFNLLQGKTWGDLLSIYRLEVALGARLWVNPDAPADP